MIAGVIMMVVCALVLTAVMYFNNLTAAKPNGNILLGISLPHSALKDERVAEIVMRYKKALLWLCVIGLALTVPYIFVIRYFSFSMLYLMVHFTAVIYFNQKTVEKYFQELYALKQERQWWLGTRQIVSIDTEVSRLKNTFPVAKKWFMIPFLISAAPFIAAYFNESTEMIKWLLPFCGLFTLIIMFYIFHLYSKERTVVYSDNTEVNLTLNRVYKREWTKCWLFAAYAGSVIFTAMSFLFLDIGGNTTMRLMVISFSSIFIVFPFIRAYNKVRDTRNKLLRLINEEVYSDGDEHWVFGAMFYNNPNDSRTLVEKRIGYGMTTNMASWAGKASYAVLAGAFAFVIGLAIWFVPLDFGSISITATGEVITINAPMYGQTLFAGEIKSVTLLHQMPGAMRTHGAENHRFLIGSFHVSGFGASRVFVHRDSPLFIYVETETERVFLNGPTVAETELFYEKIQALISNGRDESS